MKTSSAMNRLNKLMFTLSVLALASCSNEDIINDLYPTAGEGTVTFTITAPAAPGVEVSSRTGSPDATSATITAMRWLVTDPDGNVVDHHYGRIDEKFSQLTLEGLKYGDYNLIFVATLADGPEATYSNPSSFSDPWVVNNSTETPVEGLYCHKKVPFHVGPDNVSMNVILEHSVARVYVDIDMPNTSLWRHIKSVKVTFNDNIPNALDAGGTYSGSQSITAYELYEPDGVFTFTTFPSDSPVSGYVDIESSRDGGSDFVQRYEFSDLTLEKGKIAHIKLEYRHPEKESGLLHVTADELWRYNPATMFLADEPQSVFYNTSMRSFYADQPLQIWLTPDGKLGLKFFSPIPIKDVKVSGIFNKLTAETVELAIIDEVTPFMEAYFTLPVQEHDCVYESLTGRKINIPAQPNLKPENLTIFFECDDPFMQKIATIDSHWYIRFSPYGADSGHAYWRHMSPILCRHGVALALNMAFMFASPQFSEELQTYDGILYDNGQNPINLDNLRNNIRNHGGLCLGRVVGVGGLGGGQTYGLADYCYTGVYHNTTPEGANPHNYPRQAMFHEYGHCLGYGHSSNMTYGDKWTVLCAKVFVEMGRAGLLPVCNSTDVTSLPME